MSLWYYSFVYISRVKQTAFHQFHGLKSKRARVVLASSLDFDMMLFKICFTYKSLPSNVNIV